MKSSYLIITCLFIKIMLPGVYFKRAPPPPPVVFSVLHWRSMDSAGKTPAGFKVGGRKLWRMRDLERWAQWGFCDRAEFQTRLAAESNGKTP